MCAVLVASRSQAGTWGHVCETHWFAIHCSQTHRSLTSCHAKGQLRLPQPPLASTRRRRLSSGTWTMPSKIAEKGTLERHSSSESWTAPQEPPGPKWQPARGGAVACTAPEHLVVCSLERAQARLLQGLSPSREDTAGLESAGGEHPARVTEDEARTQRMPRGGDSQLKRL